MPFTRIIPSVLFLIAKISIIAFRCTTVQSFNS